MRIKLEAPVAEVGYASSGEEGNAFGLTNDVNLVTVEPSGGGTTPSTSR
jgi:hypothetical protein